MMQTTLDSLIGRACELLRYDSSAPLIFNSGLFLAGAFIVIFLMPATEMSRRFRPTWINVLLTAALLTVSMFFFVKISPFIYFNF